MGGMVSADVEFWCPSARRSVSADVEDQLSAVSGYLILGATRSAQGAGFRLTGLQRPPSDELISWVDQLIAGGGVRPRPWMDGKTWSKRPGCAIIAIDPVPDKPALTDAGAVHQRTSGRSPTVTDPSELARLFASGAAARSGAVQRAPLARLRASSEIDSTLSRPHEMHEVFALGVTATGMATDREAIFEQPFRAGASRQMARLQNPQTRDGVPIAAVRQDGVVMHAPGWHGPDATAWVDWNGSVGVVALEEYPPQGLLDTIARPDRLAASWRVATELLAAIGERGAVYLELVANAGPNRSAVAVRRWSDLDGPSDDEVQRVIRELQRAR